MRNALTLFQFDDATMQGAKPSTLLLRSKFRMYCWRCKSCAARGAYTSLVRFVQAALLVFPVRYSDNGAPNFYF